MNKSQKAVTNLFDWTEIGEPIFPEKLENGRPKCIVPGCNNPGHHTGRRKANGDVIFRKYCRQHHNGTITIKGGYRARYLLDYCENIDGRLGFRCTTTIVSEKMLEVDHINNVHHDDSPGNYQTLCASCHKVKTAKYGKRFSKVLDEVWQAMDTNRKKLFSS